MIIKEGEVGEILYVLEGRYLMRVEEWGGLDCSFVYVMDDRWEVGRLVYVMEGIKYLHWG
jgi:hypothetical protein